MGLRGGRGSHRFRRRPNPTRRAVADGDNDSADSEHRVLVQTIDKAVKRGALHRNTGARKKSRAARVRRGA